MADLSVNTGRDDNNNNNNDNNDSLPTDQVNDKPVDAAKLASTLDQIKALVEKQLIFVFPIVFPIFSFLLGKLGFSLIWSIISALLWTFALLNGHLLPTKLNIEEESRSVLISPLSPLSVSSPLTPNSHSQRRAPRIDPKFIGKLEYPHWVNFPDVHKATWINDLLTLLWPYAKAAAQNDARRAIEPHLAPYAAFIELTHFDLGETPPFLAGIKSYKTNEESVMLDLDVRAALDPKITVTAHYKHKIKLPVRVRDITVVLAIRVKLSDLVGKFPCFRTLSISLAKPPVVRFSLRLLGINIFDIPIIGGNTEKFMASAVSQFVQWPRELAIPIMLESKEEVAERQAKEPKGQLLVHLVSCSNLPIADLFSRSSDPYVKFKLGDEEVKSEVMDKNLNPVYDKSFEFTLYSLEETLFVSVYDHDKVSIKHKRLGTLDISLNSLLEQPYQDLSLALQNCERGNIHLQLEYREFAHHSGNKGVGKPSNSVLGTTEDVSNYILFINQLRGLDLGVSGAYLKVQLGHNRHKTGYEKLHGNEIAWKDKCQFQVSSVDQEQLVIQIKYKGNASKLIGATSKLATLGLAQTDAGIKSKLLGEVLVNVRDIQRTGRLQDDFPVVLPSGKFAGVNKPKLHINLMLRELSSARLVSMKSKDTLRAAIPGTLYVQLISASNLVAQDRSGTSDPFAQISVGPVVKKSSIIKETLNATWKDENFEFPVADFLKDSLVVRLKDCWFYAHDNKILLRLFYCSSKLTTIVFCVIFCAIGHDHTPKSILIIVLCYANPNPFNVLCIHCLFVCYICTGIESVLMILWVISICR
jgi:hypothetical protein